MRYTRRTCSASLPADQLEQLLVAPRPWLLSAVGGIGFALILALMVFKPF